MATKHAFAALVCAALGQEQPDEGEVVELPQIAGVVGDRYASVPGPVRSLRQVALCDTEGLLLDGVQCLAFVEVWKRRSGPRPTQRSAPRSSTSIPTTTPSSTRRRPALTRAVG